jgi:hypothetical protein
MIDAQFRFNQCNSFREEDISNAFFSETTNMIKTKLHECSLDGPLQIYVFCSDMKFKMWNYDQHKKHKVCKGPSND